MEYSKTVIAALAVSTLLVVLAGCENKEGPAERAGKDVDQALEDAGEQIEKAGENIQDAVKGEEK